MTYIKSLRKVINELIDDRIANIKSLDLFVVKAVNEETFTCDIERLNITGSYTNVFISSIGLGNVKGLMMLPSINDIVIAGFIQDSEQPVILGTLFDTFTNTPDNIPQIKQDEMLLIPKPNGSYIFIRDDNSIILKTETSKAKFNSDGFKIFNKDNYGIECDSEGEVTIRDSSGTITTTSTPGDF